MCVSESNNYLKLLRDSIVSVWLIPVIGTCVAILLDLGMLLNYDISYEYAEISLKSISLAIVQLFVICCIVIFFIWALFDDDHSPGYFRRLLQNPYLSIFPFFIWMISNNLSTYFFMYLYVFSLLIFIFIAPVFSNNKNMSYFEKVFQILKNHKNKYTENNATISESAINLDLGYIRKTTAFKSFMMYVFLMAVFVSMLVGYGKYMGNMTSVFVLKNDRSTLVIKRNNDVYLLKKFDPKTMMLYDGIEVLKLGSNSKSLELVDFHGKFMTRYDIQQKEINAKSIDKNKALIKSFLKNIRDFFINFIDFIIKQLKGS